MTISGKLTGAPLVRFFMNSETISVLNQCGFNSSPTLRPLMRPVKARVTASMRVDLPDSLAPTIKLNFRFGSTVRSL